MAVYDEAMNLLRRQNANDSASEELNSSEEGEFEAGNWRSVAIRMLVSALVIALIAAVAAWTLHSSQKTPPTKKSPSTSQEARPPQTSSKPKVGQSSKPATSSTSTPQAASGGAPAKSGATASAGTPSSSGSLTNTGPGDVVSIFIATAIVASGVYYLIVLRRLRAN